VAYFKQQPVPSVSSRQGSYTTSTKPIKVEAYSLYEGST